jgi:hypothetical protein
MGIKYVVVAQSGAPLAYDKGKAVVKPPDSTVNALDEQLDLARLSVSKSVFNYDNSAFTPEVAELPSGALDKAGSDLAAILTTDLSGAKVALPERGRFADGSGELADDVELYVARTHDANWTLTVGDALVGPSISSGRRCQAGVLAAVGAQRRHRAAAALVATSTSSADAGPGCPGGRPQADAGRPTGSLPSGAAAGQEPGWTDRSPPRAPTFTMEGGGALSRPSDWSFVTTSRASTHR